MKRILIIDNYDSFVFNVVQLLRESALCPQIEVVKNTDIPFHRLDSFQGIVLSPGPGIPAEAGSLLKLLEQCAATHPLLGICLGYQAIVEHFGGTIINLHAPLHGHCSHLKITDSTDPYRLCWPGRFVCFSPERFVRISDNRIYTYPMKGTMDATLPDAERLLLDDYKETCEHYTIVDLMRNDLNAVARGVRVTNFRYVDRIRTLKGEILQTSSEICGDLPAESCRRMGSLFRSLLPAGSISGAPKPSTLRLIRAAEGRKRGFYTGVFGYCNGKNLDSAVMIRYIEQQGQHFFFHSGGGVTINSRCDDEYREVLEKVYLSVV